MRRRLMTTVFAATTLIVVALVLPLALLLRGQAENRAMAEATLQAQALAPVVGTYDDSPDGVRLAVQRLGGSPDRIVTVFLPGGRTLGTDAPVDDAVRLARRGEAFEAEYDSGKAVLVPVQGIRSGTAVIRVDVPDQALHSGVKSAWLVLALVSVILLAVGMLLADRLGRSLVASVANVAETADRLARGDLDARAAPQGPPEVRRVGEELGKLAGRVSKLITDEREEVADLSHRLRTPITALRLDVEALPAGEDKDRIAGDVDAVETMVNDVIATARRGARDRAVDGADLAAAARERLEFWRPLAEDQGRTITDRIGSDAVMVPISPDNLDVALDALIGNVFQHTDEHVGFGMAVSTNRSGHPVLTVWDDGAGFSGPGVLDRGVSYDRSSGLGLDIVKRTAVDCGGHVIIGKSTSGGARIDVVLGGDMPGRGAGTKAEAGGGSGGDFDSGARPR
ncbi:sensor histidine kinase [Spelaeicoccus albus]|uniref:histidine kinase n=1 Tax=Spelaeicoccus albus TaxID=1280376 RepID=A0A7Z0D4D8_9MICO|nr:HAMP domain-containing sensor histidine kinase [Spelaeicoccus albus]NYI68668.1 signal transduction histidine kinase [Spelaeicoccus albus]